MRFKDKVVIVTGAASGIGLLSAQQFAAEGAKVVLTDVNIDAVTEAAEEICEKGEVALALQVDVRSYEQVKNSVDSTVKEYGRVDIMLNCAGGSAARVHGVSGPFHKIDIEIIDWGIDVNMKGPIYFCHAVLGPMTEQKSGVIINLGSVTGICGGNDMEYSAAKSGMIGLTKSLALYGAPHGIRACCVSPGPVLTRPAMANMKTPLGRAAETKEVTDFILYLSSDQAAFITGSNHIIDGGRCCGGFK
jgi:NAD(P)-dependent dehydrogenase (short-subunit alcohol dehydrogenase family)